MDDYYHQILPIVTHVLACTFNILFIAEDDSILIFYYKTIGVMSRTMANYRAGRVFYILYRVYIYISFTQLFSFLLTSNFLL